MDDARCTIRQHPSDSGNSRRGNLGKGDRIALRFLQQDSIIFSINIKNDKYGELYNSLWIKANDYALDNLKGAEARYFFEVTD